MKLQKKAENERITVKSSERDSTILMLSVLLNKTGITWLNFIEFASRTVHRSHSFNGSIERRSTGNSSGNPGKRRRSEYI